MLFVPVETEMNTLRFIYLIASLPSLLLVLQSGIHYLTICAIQLFGQTSFDGL